MILKIICNLTNIDAIRAQIFLIIPQYVATNRRNPVVFKLCAATLWGAVRNLKGAAIFFSIRRNITVFLSKFAWVCREIFLVSFRVPQAKKF
jgi:hypothetical protein